MIDTHCHLDLCDDPAAAVDETLAALITVGIDAERNEAALQLAAAYPNVWAAIGLHPNNAAAAADPEVRSRIEKQAQADRVVAIGETGFDNHWERATLAEQRHSFDWQAKLARELDLPLILHVRDAAGSDSASMAAVSALRETGYGRGVLHCFNGNQQLLEAGLQLGWFVSFAGNLTFSKATELHEAALQVPADRLLVETDSPYLAPAPKRGRSNTPAWVRFTAGFLAGLRGIAVKELEALTDRNAQRAFRLPLTADNP